MIFSRSKKHLDKVCMNYFEHFYLSMYLSGNLMIGSIRAFVHAWIPCFFGSSTTALVNHISSVINNVGCEKVNKNKK